MHDHKAKDDERQEVVQREEAVQRRLTHRGRAQKPGLNAFADERDRAEEAGDHSRAVERHLTPRQNVTHEGRCHHQKIDQHANDPCHFARGLVRTVVEAAEDVCIDSNEEERCAIHMQIADYVAAIHVAHDVLDRGKRHVHMRRVVHHQHDAGDDLHHQTEYKNDTPDPHPI